MPKKRTPASSTKRARTARTVSASREQARIVHDLGERVKELTALHEAARLLHDQRLDLPELIRRIAMLLPPAFQFPEVTAAMLRYGDIGFSTPEFRKSPWALVTNFKTRDGVEGVLRVVYTKKCPPSVEGPFLAEERHLLDSLGEILRTALDRRLAEAGLRQSQDRLTFALSAAGMGVWEWDFPSEKVSWSEELERIAGLPTGGFAGTIGAFRSLVHRDDVALVERAIGRAIDDPASGGSFQAEFRLRHADGTSRWIVSTGRVMRDGAGKGVGMLGMTHDVTARRELEHQLRQAQKMEAMGQLAGSVAHDFNNLLTAIKGYSEFVVNALEPGDKRRGDVEQITAAAERAAGLTHQLLAFSRHQALAPRVIDANVVVARMENLLRRLIGATIDLRVTLQPGVVATRVDPGQLGQVVMNLAVNARDAMPDGGVLSIESSVVDIDSAGTVDVAPGRYAAIVVRDTGVGMTAEVMTRIFEPFFTTKQNGRGSGLGLATVYGIVRQSGGAVTPTSTPGHGATFTVLLPCTGTTIESVEAVTERRGTPRGSECVLFVDDDTHVRALAERALKENGYRTIACANGDEALAAATTNDIDIIVTDIVMPRMQGPELVKRVRARQPNARVLYITGFAEHTLDGIDASSTVLQKPFAPGELLRAVRDVLNATAK